MNRECLSKQKPNTTLPFLYLGYFKNLGAPNTSKTKKRVLYGLNQKLFGLNMHHQARLCIINELSAIYEKPRTTSSK